MTNHWADFQLIFMGALAGLLVPLIIILRSGIGPFRNRKSIHLIRPLHLRSRYSSAFCLIQVFILAILLIIPCAAILGLEDRPKTQAALAGIGFAMILLFVGLLYSIRTGDLSWRWEKEE